MTLALFTWLLFTLNPVSVFTEASRLVLAVNAKVAGALGNALIRFEFVVVLINLTVRSTLGLTTAFPLSVHLISFVDRVFVQSKELDVNPVLPAWLATETSTAPLAENKLECTDVISKKSAPPCLVASRLLVTLSTMSTDVAIDPCT